MADEPRVLIVDDDPTNRLLLKGMVERQGAAAILCSGGLEALSKLEEIEVDLIVLDLMMPDLDGLGVIRELTARGVVPGTPVLVVTANHDTKTRHAALDAGAVDFVTKPMNIREASSKIGSLAELGRLRREAVIRAEREARTQVEEAVASVPLVLFQAEHKSPGNVEGSWIVGDPMTHFGFDEGAFLGCNLFSLIHPDDHKPLAAAIELAFSGPDLNFSLRCRIDGGNGAHWSQFVVRADPAAGMLRGVAMRADEQVALEEQLLSAQRLEALGRLAGGIAHDFNNLLAVILSYSVFVRDELEDGDARKTDIERAILAAEKAAGLTRHLLTFATRTPVEVSAVNLNLHLTQLRPLVMQSLTEKVRMEISLESEPAVIDIDPFELDQLIMNLAVNARAAMPDGGTFSIRVDSPAPAPSGNGRIIRMHLQDSGIGMDEVTRQRIFEPFFSTKDRGQGVGLGLATCFGIVKKAGATIEVSSTIGVGTTFTISFPVSSVTAIPERPQPDTASAGLGRVVLVAEDDPDLRLVTVRALEAVGYQAHAVADGEAAIRALDEFGHTFAAVVSDVVMPKKSGYLVIEHAGQVAPHAALLLTSGYTDGSVNTEVAPDVPVLWKPVAPSELVQRVGVAIALVERGHVSRSISSLGFEWKPQILLIEADESVRDMMMRVFTNAGLRVNTAGSIAEGRRVLEEGPLPGAVVCDISAPDGSVVDLLQWISDTHPDLRTRCVVLVAASANEVGERLLAGTMTRVLAKPLVPSELLAAVNRVVRIGSGSRSVSRSVTTSDDRARFGES